jgi:hypothetical protein
MDALTLIRLLRCALERQQHALTNEARAVIARQLAHDLLAGSGTPGLCRLAYSECDHFVTVAA